MTLIRLFDSDVSCRLCLSLLHSLWQAAILTLVVEGVARVWRRMSVEWKYVLHVAALLLTIVLLPITYWRLSAAPAASGAIPPAAATADDAFEDDRGASADATVSRPVEPVLRQRPSLNVMAAAPPQTDSGKSGLWERSAAIVAGVYAAGVVLMLLRLSIAVTITERQRRTALPLWQGHTSAAIGRMARRWRMRKTPLVAQSARIVIPTVVGLLKPTILLPTSALSGLSSQELELILAHELAHIRRYDLWVNVVQRLAEAVLFFNPALWYLSRRISVLREYCCDELACRESSAGQPAARVDYAKALLRIVELAKPASRQGRELVSVAAAGQSPSELRRRVARLFGEPLVDRLSASRPATIAAIALLLAMCVGPRWLHSEPQTVSQPTESVEVNYPPPASDADKVVAEARAHTFGLEQVPRLYMRLSSWNSTISSMRRAPEQSLKLLWQARGRETDDAMRRNTQQMATLAWDGAWLLFETDHEAAPGAAAPVSQYKQSRFWNGHEGWLGEITAKSRAIYRYASLDELTDHMMASIYFPQFSAAGGRLTWNGPALEFDEYNVDPSLTRYKLVRTETVDSAECDVYEGPARQELIWIEKSSGLIKACCRQYVHDELPGYFTEKVREVAGRTFADAREYREWIKGQPADVQAKLSAYWGASHWKLSTPGNLSVFSDYREIAPGVRWPMRCEKIVVHPIGPGDSNKYQYYRAESMVTEVKREFAIEALAKSALPQEGDQVTDRREKPAITYAWNASLRGSEVGAMRAKKAEEQRKADEKEKRINETPINSVADALHILTDGPDVEPTKVWARAIKYLTEHQPEALPAVIKQLDVEQRDHPLSKLAFTLRAMGDRRAVPALIRALPRTLLKSRSDYGLIVEDPELIRFMQKNDQQGKIRDSGDYFDYGRAFREVTSALHRLTGQRFNEMELNWVHLEPGARPDLQRAQFHEVAERWAAWWEANWESMVDDPEYSKVNLPELKPTTAAGAKRTQPPAGPHFKLNDVMSGWVVQAADESKQRCFIDLDTMREGGWPSSLPPVGQLGTDSPDLLAWAKKEGFDAMGVRYTPPGETTPLYCLKPIDLMAWKITVEDLKTLGDAVAGKRAYPLSQPVQMLVPRRKIDPPYDYEHDGDSFLFVTREGTAGVIRMTAQVTEAERSPANPFSRDWMFSPTGYYRGVRLIVSVIEETASIGSDRSKASGEGPNATPPKEKTETPQEGDAGSRRTSHQVLASGRTPDKAPLRRVAFIAAAPELLCLSWMSEGPEASKGVKARFWDRTGTPLSEQRTAEMLKQVGDWHTPVSDDTLTPLALVFRVDKRLKYSPIIATAVTADGRRHAQGSARSTPVDGVNLSTLAPERGMLPAWPRTVSLELKYPIEDVEVIKVVTEIPEAPIELADGVSWYLDRNRAMEFPPPPSASRGGARQAGEAFTSMKRAEGKTAGVLQQRRDAQSELTSYGARVYLKNGQRLQDGYSTIIEPGGLKHSIEVSAAFGGKSEIEKIEFSRVRYQKTLVRDVVVPRGG